MGLPRVMITKSLFDQFLKSVTGPVAAGGGMDIPGLSTGAAAGGVLGLLLGSKSGRKILSSAATVGGLAVVGGLAYRAVRGWRDSQAASPNALPPVSSTEFDYSTTPDEFIGTGKGSSTSLEIALISAMIAAAKADGRIDSSEQMRIFESLDKTQLSKPQKEEIFRSFDEVPTPERIAALATTLEHRSEVYLVSCLTADPEHPQVSAHLQRLATALELPSELMKQLQLQALSARRENLQ